MHVEENCYHRSMKNYNEYINYSMRIGIYLQNDFENAAIRIVDDVISCSVLLIIAYKSS